MKRVLLACLLATANVSNLHAIELGGHAKYRFTVTGYPDDSVFEPLLGSSSQGHGLDVRLKLREHAEAWDFKLDYQFIALDADTLSLTQQLPSLVLPVTQVISDDRRWWNLTRSNLGSNDAVIHRLDRLNVGYASDDWVMRFGRQAISWGNGLLFTPMDIFNPFDPAAVDKEYKTGDDMLYLQYLLPGGNDLQMVAVIRRDLENGDVEARESSLAFKYHGFNTQGEYDLLLAQHFDEWVLGAGYSIDVAGAVWRGDLVWADTGSGGTWSAVTSLSYSWVTAGHNVTGLLELFYNGYGQAGGDYSLLALQDNDPLLERLARGELFNLGRYYLGASATIEMTPLLLLNPNLFVNLEDPSALAQLVVNYDWLQDVQVLAAISLPIGKSGSEYGGIESPVPDYYLSTDASALLQFAWYF
ncbi:MAG: hypothetical protein ACWA5Q_11565 [bacterium]